MTLDQVKYLREQLNADMGEGKPVANSVFYDLDNNMAFRNNGDFVIFDDDNELLHCIAANRNNFVKHESPYCLYSASYEQLQFTEGNLTIEGLTHVLDNMMSSLITDAQKTQIKNWAMKLPVNPMNPVNSTYFKDPAPEVYYRPVTVITRPDGVHNGYPVTGSVNKSDVVKTTTADKAVTVIAGLEDGSTIMISGNDAISVATNITSNDVTITAKDLPMDGGVTISGENVTVKGITFQNANTNENDKLLHITGNNATIDSCMFSDNGQKTSIGVLVDPTEVYFKDCVFTGANGIYNTIDAAVSNKKIKKFHMENCTFEKESATHNFINIFNFEDDAEVIFENCTFKCGANTNAVRLSNVSNAKVTVIFNNCKYSTEATDEYAGVVLLQDHSGNQDFANITINFINLCWINGNKINSNGSGSNQIWYTYQSETSPIVNFS